MIARTAQGIRDNVPSLTEQSKRWNHYKELAANCGRIARSNEIRAQMCDIALKFAMRRNVPIPFVGDIFERTEQIVKLSSRQKRHIDWVEDGTLGLWFTKDRDIDIMAYPNSTSDEIANYKSLGAWQLIALGIVIVAGAIGFAYYMYKRSERDRNEYNRLLTYMDRKFCADPSDPNCAQWEEEKRENDFGEKKTLLQEIDAGITSVTGKIGTGLGVGLALALPLAALVLAKRSK